MSKDKGIRQEIIYTLLRRGYEPISEVDLKNDKYSGDLSMFYSKTICIGNMKIEWLLDFSDISMLDFPNVYISKQELDKIRAVYAHISAPMPHLYPEILKLKGQTLYSLCFQLHEARVVPRTSLNSLLFIVEQQVDFSLRNLIDKQKYQNELITDFGGVLVTLCRSNSLDGLEEIYFKNLNRSRTSIQELEPILSTYVDGNYTVTNQRKNFFIVISIDSNKIPNFQNLTDESYQSNFGKFLTFMEQWDPINYRVLMALVKTKNYGSRLLLIICWRGFTFLVTGKWNRKSQFSIKHENNKELRETLIEFIKVTSLDFKESIMRNLPGKYGKGLSDISIFQVGLGAIGGYMADALLKIGAGINKKYILVDKDNLKPENIGRHFLGFEFCGFSKVSAFLSYCRKQYFHDSLNNIKGYRVGIQKFDHQYFIENPTDLIIDTTGSIEVQEYLNEVVQSVPIEVRPILVHLWVYGNGECVQALWVNPQRQIEEGGCITCLGESGGEQFYPKYSPVEPDFTVERKLGACAAFTPYAVSGGMMIASMGANMILEWLATGDVVYNYQTRYSSIYHGVKIDDMSVKRNSLCRNCNIF